MAGGGGGESGERKLDQTPTWAVAGVCAVIILISFVLEKGLHGVGTWLTKKQKRALYEALDKVKGELMILGFISLLLTFSQSYISRICIPSKVADTMLPCKPESESTTPTKEHRRRLLWSDRRALVSGSSTETCKPVRLFRHVIVPHFANALVDRDEHWVGCHPCDRRRFDLSGMVERCSIHLADQVSLLVLVS